MLKKTSKLQAVASLTAVAIAAGQAVAEPIELETSLSTEYSDNVRRNRDKESDIIYTAFVGGRYNDATGIFNTSLEGLLGFEHYQNSTYGDDTTVDLDWMTVAEILPSRFLWRIQDNLKDTRRTSLRPSTPDNRERRNFFSTGPVYLYPLTPTDTWRFSADYARTDYEKSAQADTERYNAAFGWLHVTPNRLNINWNNGVEKVEFDNDNELLNLSTGLSLSKRHEYFDWRVEGGYAQTEADQFGAESTYDGFEGEGQVRYQINSDSLLTLFASHQLTDTSSQFAVLVFDIPFTFNFQQVVKLTVYRVGYDVSLTARDKLAVNLSHTQEEFQTTEETEEGNFVEARWDHRFTPTLTGFAFGVGEQRQFTELDRTDKIIEVGVGLKSEMYRNLVLEGFTGYRRQVSDGSDFDYNELRFGIKAIYYPYKG